MCHAVNNFRARKRFLLAALLAIAVASRPAWAADPAVVHGFSEAYRVMRVAGVESGVLKRLFVQEGDEVREGQPLGELDTAVHKAMLEIAKASRDARGDLDLARAEQRLRQHRLDILLQLHADTYASDEETRRARTELEVAAAQLRSAEEKQLLRKLEFDRLAAQLEARTIRAPQDGTILSIQKLCGEYLGPNDPVLLTLVQLQPLAAVFLVPREQVVSLNVGQSVAVFFPASNRLLDGTIEFMAPVVDAGSGTITVRVRVDNADRLLRAGEPCELRREAQPLATLKKTQQKTEPVGINVPGAEIGPRFDAPSNPLRSGAANPMNSLFGKKSSAP